jgi:hypothetical protein
VDEEVCDRVRAVGAAVGFNTESGGLRIELLDTIKTQALAGRQQIKLRRTPDTNANTASVRSSAP